jgi:tetratricopeptide (TPR) repeat protein
MPFLSLCLIVRDECARLRTCLASLQGLCDETLVVDTGSADGSARLAASLGARVEHFEWCDDFAAARNAALAAARGDWVLFVDADEALDTRLHDAVLARQRLLDFCERRSDCAGRVRMVNDLAEGVSTQVEVTRFVRRATGRFAGRIHEQWIAYDGCTRRRATDLTLRHSGYAPQAIHAGQKLERNLRLLALDAAERPDDAYVRYQLGRTLAAAERPREALVELERALELSTDADEWALHAVELGAASLRALGRSAQALELVRGALPASSGRTDTQFLAALLALDCGDVAAAEAGFRQCLERGPDHSSSLESDPAAGTWAAAYNLGVISEHTARPGEARAHYRRALEWLPSHAPSCAGLERLDRALPSPRGMG